MQKSPSVSPDTSVPVAADGAPEATSLSSPPISRTIDRAGLWSSVPVLLFCTIGLSLRAPAPAPQTVDTVRAVEAMQVATFKQSPTHLAVAGVIAADETMIATLRPANGYATLHGALSPAVQVRGEAPIGGRVTQVLVKTGQQVRVGDPVLRVEGKVNAPGSTVARRKQDAAEAVQVAAARQQESLQRKLLVRQEKLEKAQQRVAAAQKRVSLARDVLQRLARGESVTRTKVASLATPQLHTRLASRGAATERKNAAKEAQRQAAEREAQQARRESKQAIEAAEQAEREAQAAAKLVQAKKQAAKDAQAQIARAEEQLSKGEAKNTDVEAARNAATVAHNAEKEAAAKAEAAQKSAAKAESEAEKLRVAANAADKKFAQLEPVAVAESTPAPSPTLSTDEAAQLAQDALKESTAAASEAQRLKREIDSYARQVNSLHATMTNASENLEAAQMAVVESKIAEKLESVRSPASGVVLDVAETARRVTPGETIIAIGRPDQLELRFKDSSDAWKTLKPGATLAAVVRPANGKEVPVMANLREIEAPEKAGEPALLIATIANPRAESGGGRRFAPGLKAICSIPRPGAREALSVPATALLQDDGGQTMLAVLAPVVVEDATQAPELFRVEWREVTPGQGNGVVREIAGGLKAGERIALRPEPLRQLTQSHGSDALVKLTA